MSVITGFTRQEIAALTGLTSTRLTYFDRTGLIVPQKFGNPKKPTCIYTWEQLLELLAIKDLRRKISLQTVRKVVEALEQFGFSPSLRDKHLVVLGDEVFWVKDSWDDLPEQVLKIKGNKGGVGQYLFAFMVTVDDLINQAWKKARKSSTIDFQSFQERAKAQPSKKAA